ncbi:protein SPIRAL1-like 2 isoform X1 [Primulina tabacum]|uniref:protein SPIRAL1-like 2 isoform X1 n=1 Tax=Primulina tabacum TaxID=48773 RepID=UPI003F5A216B
MFELPDRPHINLQRKNDKGRGVSSGGGQSSLGYLFGSGEVPKPSPDNAKDVATESRASHKEHAPKPNAADQPVDDSKQIPAGIQSSTMNKHSRSGVDNICNSSRYDLARQTIVMRIGHQQRSRLLLVEVLLLDIYLVAAANKI